MPDTAHDTETRETMDCGCSWLYVQTEDDRFVTAVTYCAEHTPHATYHGIVRAKCLTCGYEATEPTTLELWNDYGVQCPQAQGNGHPFGKTEWQLVNGEVRITESDEDAF